MMRKLSGKWHQPYFRTVFTGLDMATASVGETARAGRSRWPIKNRMFNGLTRHCDHFSWAGPACPS